jgi:hypothetical protein
MREHEPEGLVAGRFTKGCKYTRSSTKQSAQPANDRHRQRSRPHCNAAHQTEAGDDAKAWQLKGRRRLHLFDRLRIDR